MVLEVKNLTKNYKSVKAVDNISFSIEKGDVYGFLGPNGAGKTTTIRMILGLLKPTSGEVYISGKSVTKDFYNSIKKIGALVENPAFYEYLTAEKNLQIFGHYSGGVSSNKIDEILKLVGLYERRKEKVKNYSLGMKQRLGIAQTLLNDPEIIVLDEPINGLDPEGINDIRNLILKLSKEMKVTVFISSHILSEIQEICNKIFIINTGKEVIKGNTKDLLKSSNSSYIIESSNKDLLLKFMKDNSIEIINEDKGIFNLSNKKPEEVLNELLKEKIQITSFQKETLKLEEFYFNVTKGN